MSQKQIDETLKNRLEAFDSNLDKDSLWMDIFHRVPQKSKKRRMIFWWLSGSALLVVITAFLWMANLEQEKKLKGPDSSYTKYAEQSPSIPQLIKDTEKNFQDATISDNANESESHSNNDVELQSGNTMSPRIQETDSDDKQSIRPEHNTVNSSPYKTEDSAGFTRAPIDENETTGQEHIKSTIPNERLNPKARAPMILELLPLISSEVYRHLDPVMLPTKRQRKRIKPVEKPIFFAGLTYSAGGLSESRKGILNEKGINEGSPYFSHALSLEYGHFLNRSFYGVAGLSFERSYNKLDGKVSRDTVVPSPLGEQVLIQNTYSNGDVDTKSGIPEVLTTFNRRIVHLNTFSRLNVSIGLGYLNTFGKVRYNIESSLSRSFSTSYDGKAISNSLQRVVNLENVTSFDISKNNYSAKFKAGLGIPLIQGTELFIGGEYTHGLTNLSIKENESIRQNTLRGYLTIRKVFWSE